MRGNWHLFYRAGRIIMEFVAHACTDVGIKKKNNQDSLMVKSMVIDGAQIALGVLCDGVGGLSKGELASSTVIRAFERWATERLPMIFHSPDFDKLVYNDWNNLINENNQKIRAYGQRNHLTLGTTITAILIVNDKYFIVNIGDSRTYEIREEVTQLTKDQTIVEYELAKGIITPEQAAVDTRKSILLQCIGASEILVPDFFTGTAKENAVYMLCSDGFRHLISKEEIYDRLSPEKLNDSDDMEKNIRFLIELNKERKEQDNISVVTIKTV